MKTLLLTTLSLLALLAVPATAAETATEKAAAPALSEGLAKLLPEELIKADGSKVPASSLAGKPLVGIYFSAHWCGPCRGFTPRLVEFRNANSEDIEIVFVSSDRSAEAMMNYMTESKMSWLAVPKDSPNAKLLKEKSGHRGIPSLMIFRADGSIAVKNGRGDVAGNPEGAIAKWKAAE